MITSSSTDIIYYNVRQEILRLWEVRRTSDTTECLPDGIMIHIFSFLPWQGGECYEVSLRWRSLYVTSIFMRYSSSTWDPAVELRLAQAADSSGVFSWQRPQLELKDWRFDF